MRGGPQDGAIALFANVIESNPTHRQALMEYSKAVLDRAKYSDAVKIGLNLLVNDPNGKGVLWACPFLDMIGGPCPHRGPYSDWRAPRTPAEDEGVPSDLRPGVWHRGIPCGVSCAFPCRFPNPFNPPTPTPGHRPTLRPPGDAARAQACANA